MKTAYFINVLIISLLLFSSSCNKDLSAETVEKRLLGTWRIDKVKMKKQGTNTYKNVTSNFTRYSINFDNNGILSYFDSQTSSTYEGYWYIWEVDEWDSDDEEYQTKQTIEISIYDPILDISSEMTWEDISISNKKLKFTEFRDGNKYKFTLVK